MNFYKKTIPLSRGIIFYTYKEVLNYEKYFIILIHDILTCKKNKKFEKIKNF